MRMLVTLFLMMAVGCGEPKKHPWGKDTVKQFGDGHWSLLKVHDANGKRNIMLFDYDQQSSALSNVVDWRESGDWVYAINGKGTFAVVNFRTNAAKSYPNVEAAPAQHQDELRKLNTQ